jgi:hypothetical protein
VCLSVVACKEAGSRLKKIKVGSAMTWHLLSGRGARRERPGERGQGEDRIFSQGVKGRGPCPMARVNGRRRPVGLGGGRRLSARQVFDGLLSTRASSIEDKKDRTKLRACSARLKHAPRRSVARFLGQRGSL